MDHGWCTSTFLKEQFHKPDDSLKKHISIYQLDSYASIVCVMFFSDTITMWKLLLFIEVFWHLVIFQSRIEIKFESILKKWGRKGV